MDGLVALNDGDARPRPKGSQPGGIRALRGGGCQAPGVN
jgi:hypothetical protein